MKIEGLKYPENTKPKPKMNEDIKYVFLNISNSNAVVYENVLNSININDENCIYGLVHSGDALSDRLPKEDASWFASLIKPYIGKVILILEWKSANVHEYRWAEEWLDEMYKLTGVAPLILMPTPYINAFNWESVSKKFKLITYKEKDLEIRHSGWKYGPAFECETLGFGYSGIRTKISVNKVKELMLPTLIPKMEDQDLHDDIKNQNGLKKKETE